MKLFVLANTNVAPIVSRLSGHDVELADFGALIAPLVDVAGPAHATDLDVLLVLLDGDELVDSGELAQELVSVLGAYSQQRRDVVTIVSTVRVDAATPLTYAGTRLPDGPYARQTEINAALHALAEEHDNVELLDIDLLYDRFGRDALISTTFWYAGRVRYTPRWFDECARHISWLLDAHLSRARKVLVLDLDGTLWGGILGEDGPGGIALGEDGVGKCYRDLQRRIKVLQGTGVLLAVASKNDWNDVESVLADHPMMLIRPDDLAAWRVDWNDKASNIVAIADDLSLGLDSFVLLDDNPVERARVSESLPDVAVPDFPVRPELLADWFVQEVAFPFFPKVRVLATDRDKTQQYRARNQRQQVLAALPDLETFLEQLEIQLDLRIDEPMLVDRAAQMTQKTNQFNLTLRRCSPGDLRHMQESSQYAVVTAGYSDRFGDEGVVGLAILDLEAAEVVVFLLSCRVLGRGVEHRLLQQIVDLAVSRKLSVLECTYVPGARNGVAAAFLADEGWSIVGDAATDGPVRYRKELA